MRTLHMEDGTKKECGTIFLRLRSMWPGVAVSYASVFSSSSRARPIVCGRHSILLLPEPQARLERWNKGFLSCLRSSHKAYGFEQCRSKTFLVRELALMKRIAAYNLLENLIQFTSSV